MGTRAPPETPPIKTISPLDLIIVAVWKDRSEPEGELELASFCHPKVCGVSPGGCDVFGGSAVEVELVSPPGVVVFVAAAGGVMYPPMDHSSAVAESVFRSGDRTNPPMTYIAPSPSRETAAACSLLGGS